MQVVRITVDLLRPVPIAPLKIRAEVLREGRKIQLCAVTLLHEDVVVVRATVLKIRRAELELPPTAVEEKVTLPGPDAGQPADIPNENPNAFIRGLGAARRAGAISRARPRGDLVSRRAAAVRRSGADAAATRGDDRGLLQRRFHACSTFARGRSSTAT